MNLLTNPRRNLHSTRILEQRTHTYSKRQLTTKDWIEFCKKWKSKRVKKKPCLLYVWIGVWMMGLESKLDKSVEIYFASYLETEDKLDLSRSKIVVQLLLHTKTLKWTYINCIHYFYPTTRNSLLKKIFVTN